MNDFIVMNIILLIIVLAISFACHSYFNYPFNLLYFYYKHIILNTVFGLQSLLCHVSDIMLLGNKERRAITEIHVRTCALLAG